MFKRREKRGKTGIWIIAIGLILILVSGIGVIAVKFEGENPKIELDPTTGFAGVDTAFTGVAVDRKSGIRKLYVGMRQGSKEVVLVEADYGSDDLRKETRRHEVPFTIEIDSRKLKIDDGPATVDISAWDYSWRRWFNGNRTDITFDIVIDTKPPQIEVLSTSHNISLGGSGLVIYRLSEACDTSGVYVGADFFPGRSGHYSDPDIFLAFIAVDSRLGRDTQMYVHAADQAGNTTRRGFYYRILGRSFKTDTINISDDFLNMKLPEFYAADGWPADASTMDQFLFVNKVLRGKNNAVLLGMGPESEALMFWQGAFGRLPNSAQQAGFADHRLYSYNGEVIDEETHLGIDLASVRQAPVPASNAGRVVMADFIGIYGNTVCVDHGFGLFSLYSHLSNVNVAPGDMVSRGDVVGHTGITGWAGGDHLHFSMIVNHVFVNPVEWWDPAWIRNNITDKLDGVVSRQQ